MCGTKSGFGATRKIGQRRSTCGARSYAGTRYANTRNKIQEPAFLVPEERIYHVPRVRRYSSSNGPGIVVACTGYGGTKDEQYHGFSTRTSSTKKMGYTVVPRTDLQTCGVCV